VNVGELAALLTSIAAVISAIAGGVVGVLALTRGSPREREQAAKAALDRLAGKDEDDTNAEQWKAIEKLQRRLGGSDQP
jgi:hypothetical protein